MPWDTIQQLDYGLPEIEPKDMYLLAVDQPRAWIVCREAHDQVASCWKQGCVTSRRVVEFQTRHAAIPGTWALADDIEIWEALVNSENQAKILSICRKLTVTLEEMSALASL